MKENINEDILKRYFANTCSRQERALVEKWLDPIESWNKIDTTAAPDGAKDRIWLAVADKTGYTGKSKSKIVSMIKYAAASAAAVLIVLFGIYKTNEPLSGISTDSPSLVFEKLHFKDLNNERKENSEYYRVTNGTDKPIFLTTTTNGRSYRLEGKKAYLTVCLDDPGVFGDEILILSPEQINLLPDAPLTSRLASIVNQNRLKTSAPNFL